jgi:hypothetical protein
MSLRPDPDGLARRRECGSVIAAMWLVIDLAGFLSSVVA